MPEPQAWRVRVYWEDTDAGGVVYYANYLKFIERARTEWLRSRGLEQSALRAEHAVLLVVRKLECAYRAPARLDDELTVHTRIEKLAGASVTMHQVVSREGAELFNATVNVCCLDADRWSPKRLPAPVEDILARSLTENSH